MQSSDIMNMDEHNWPGQSEEKTSIHVNCKRIESKMHVEQGKVPTKHRKGKKCREKKIFENEKLNKIFFFITNWIWSSRENTIIIIKSEGTQTYTGTGGTWGHMGTLTNFGITIKFFFLFFFFSFYVLLRGHDSLLPIEVKVQSGRRGDRERKKGKNSFTFGNGVCVCMFDALTSGMCTKYESCSQRTFPFEAIFLLNYIFFLLFFSFLPHTSLAASFIQIKLGAHTLTHSPINWCRMFIDSTARKQNKKKKKTEWEARAHTKERIKESSTKRMENEKRLADESNMYILYIV